MRIFAWRWITMVALALVILPGLAACQGPQGLNVGVFGGSRGNFGVGVGFPMGGWPGNVANPLPESSVPYGVREIVAENDLYYRRFLGLTPQGGFVVQDFYKSTPAEQGNSSVERKLTDAYVLSSRGDMVGPLFTEVVQTQGQGGLNPAMVRWLEQFRADGVYVLWYADGRKALQTSYQNDALQGQWTQWYANGVKHWQGMYAHGQRRGVWSHWDEQGRLLEEIRPSGP